MADTVGSEPMALFKKRAAKGNARKRPAVTAATPHRDDASGSDGYSSNEDNTARLVKRHRKGGVVLASSASTASCPDSLLDLKPTEFMTTNSTTITDTNDATKTNSWYDETNNDTIDSRELLGASSYGQPIPSSTRPKEATNGMYRGAAAYTSHIQKSKNTAEKTSSIGPIKAPPSNVRTITVTDFAPDVCKDYKQTGFCGFGDSCKFLHAREDYKQGWELDKEWEKVATGKRSAGGKVVGKANRSAKGAGEDDEDENALLEGIPFACIICKQPYNNPVVTKCGHYFCEKCALDRYRKNPNCAACGAGTNGVFNVAKGLKKILERKRRLALKMREDKIEAGGHLSGEDEDG